MSELLDKDPIVSKRVQKAVHAWSSTDDLPEEHEQDESYAAYRKYILRKWLFMAICIAVALLTMGVALTIGDYPIGFFESYQILFDHIINNIGSDFESQLRDHIIINGRMPRIVIGFIAGAGLAISGAVMQSTLLNPLADSYTTGVSSGASFGATLSMTVGVSFLSGTYGIVGNAFVFSLVPTAVIIFVSKLKNASPTVMIMSGIAIMYLFNACTTVMMLWANPTDLESVYEWQVGSLAKAKWDYLPIMLPIVLVGFAAMQLMSRKINVLATGEDSANALGIEASKLRMINMIIIALVTASIVSFVGLIGFVGLVAPHIVRLFIGPDNRFLIPASAAFGGMLMVLADLLGRTIIAPAVLPVGVILAFLGGPMFLWLIMGKNSKIWG